MAYKAKNEVTDDSRKIINVCRNLLSDSGMSIKEFLYSSGLGNNYWYMRMRYEAPLNTSDVEHIASTFGLTSLDIYTRALGSDAARAYAARERQTRSPTIWSNRDSRTCHLRSLLPAGTGTVTWSPRLRTSDGL